MKDREADSQTTARQTTRRLVRQQVPHVSGVGWVTSESENGGVILAIQLPEESEVLRFAINNVEALELIRALSLSLEEVISG